VVSGQWSVVSQTRKDLELVVESYQEPRRNHTRIELATDHRPLTTF
jgi:hypothetical protein